MNLQSKKARIPIAALGVTALCTAGLGVLATSAFAAALTATPGTTSVTITDLDPSAVTSPVNINALATYGVQITGVDTTAPLKVVATGPSAAAGSNVYIQATTTTPTSAGTWAHPSALVTTLAGSTGTSVAATPSATGRYYIGATYPGTYTLKFYQEGTSGNATAYDDDTLDNALATMTVNVKDVNATTATTSDDLNLSLTSTPASILKGEVVSSTVTVGDLTTSDVRGTVGSGTYPSRGVLGNSLIGPLTLTYSLNGGGSSNGAGLFYNGSVYKNTSNAAGAAGSLVTTAAIGSAISQQSTSTVADNNVTGLTYQNPDTPNVDFPTVTGGGTAVVRTGIHPVTYKVKAVDTGSVVVPNARVFFRILPLSGGSTATVAGDLTTSAGTPDSDGDVSVLTDDSGIATLTVTSAATASGNRYSVTPRSNGYTGLAALNATYTTAAATTIKDVKNIAALAGGTATITGRVVDQFGESISPAGAAATITNSSGGAFTPSPGVFALTSSGTFSGTVTDSGSSTSNHTSGFSVAVTGVGSAATGTIAWRTSITPATASFTNITNSAAGTSTLPLAAGSTATVDLSDSSGITTEILNGTVKDSSSNGLPYASVTYSGSDGVYFLNSSNQLVGTITAPATSTGALEDLDTGTAGVAVVFTKTGSATITMVAGSATDAVTVPVEAATDSWKVIAQDAKSKPGQTISLLGKILDAFGNPVVGRQVTLSLDTASAGSLSGTDANALAGFQVVTDNQGVWSTPFTSTANQDGTVTLTATLVNAANSANIASNAVLVANAAYANAGLTVAAGEYQDTAEIQVVDPTTGIASTGTLVGGGKAQISGTAEAGASVDLYARPSGSSGFALVKSLNADSTGMWGIGSTLTKTTSFFARSGGKTSDTVTTVVYSYETVKAKALGKGMVQFKVYGTPNVKGVVNIYLGSTRLAHVGTDSHGDVTVNVKSKTGKRTFVIYFVAPGTSLKGKSLTGTVK